MTNADPMMIVIVAAIGLRVLLDLFSIRRSSYKIDAIYTVLFLVVGVLAIAKNRGEAFGYLCTAVGIVWAFYGILRYRKRDHRAS